MAPPKYADLNLEARELITKGFNYGHYRSEFELGKFYRGFMQYNNESKSSRAVLTTLHHWPQYGVKFKNHLASPCEILSEIELKSQLRIKDQFADGLKLSFEISFMPFIGKKSSLMMLTQKHPDSMSSALVHFDFTGTLVSLSTVKQIPKTNIYMGMQYDLTNTSLFTHLSILHPLSVTLAYLTKPLSASLSVSRQTEYQLLVHKRLGKNVRVGTMCDWSSLTNKGKVIVGGKLKTSYGVFKLKGNSMSQLSGAFQFRPISNLSVILSAQLQCDKKSSIGHKLGLGVKFSM